MPDALTSPQGSGYIKCQIQNTVGSDVYIVVNGLILMLMIWNSTMKVISLSNQIPAMIAVIMNQHQTIRNSQMLILVCNSRGLRPFFGR